jgi:hypothetical protein
MAKERAFLRTVMGDMGLFKIMLVFVFHNNEWQSCVDFSLERFHVQLLASCWYYFS